MLQMRTLPPLSVHVCASVCLFAYVDENMRHVGDGEKDVGDSSVLLIG